MERIAFEKRALQMLYNTILYFYTLVKYPDMHMESALVNNIHLDEHTIFCFV